MPWSDLWRPMWKTACMMFRDAGYSWGLTCPCSPMQWQLALRFNSQCCALRACYSMASISAHFLVHKVNLHKNETKVKILPTNWAHKRFEITLGEHRNTRGVFKLCLLIFKLARPWNFLVFLSRYWVDSVNSDLKTGSQCTCYGFPV